MTTTIEAQPAVPEPPRLVREFKLWLPGPIARLPEWARITGFLVLVILISLLVRTHYLNGQLWMDEAIATGISSHSLTSIPGILRMDGSPPLYYLALHIWMSMFGNSEAATHSLSLLFGTLTIPIGYWAGKSLVSTRAGVMAAVLFGTSAFITDYSQETRMYALMALLGLITTVGFVHGFVYRRRKFVWMFGIGQALMLYTHAWGIFYGAGSFLAVALIYRISDSEDRKNYIRDVLCAYIGAGILFIPWIGNFIFQTVHTAAPWDSAPRFGAPVQLSQNLMGGDSITAACLLATLIGVSDLFLRRNRSTKLAHVFFALVAIPFFTLLLAWIASQVTPAWVPRYFAPIVAPVLLAFALGMSRAGIVGVGALIFAFIFLSHPAAYAPAYKSDVKDVSAEISQYTPLHPNDLVIVAQPEQVPLAYYYFPGGLRYASTMGAVKDPTYMNWIHSLKKLRDAVPSKVLPPLINSLKPGQQLVYLRPLTDSVPDWSAPWTQMVRRRAAEWGEILQQDVDKGILKAEFWAPHYYRGATNVADAAVVYKKVG